MAAEPMTITLRYLQTLTEIASEKNSTIIFPLPIELMNLLERQSARAEHVRTCQTCTNWPTTASTKFSSAGSSSSSCSWRRRSSRWSIFLCGVQVGRGVKAAPRPTRLKR